MTERKSKFDQKQLFNHLAKDFNDLVSNKQVLRPALENFFNNLIDELTLGIIFDLHKTFKTNAFSLDVDDGAEDGDSDDPEITYPNKNRKVQFSMCPICNKLVGSVLFASHLAGCMGLGGRKTTRRTACNNNYGGDMSDDDDDMYLTSEQQKKKKDKNGSKKKGGTPKKNVEIVPPEINDSSNVDIEGEDEELTNLRDILRLQDHSNSTSPADSALSSGTSKKKDKVKNKKGNKREKRSPSPGSS